MAKQIAVTKSKKSISALSQKKKKVSWEFPLQRKNIMILGSGVIMIILGYLLMATGITDDPALPSAKWNNPMAVTVAPIFLVLGYCVIIPYSLIKIFRNKKDNEL